MSYRSIGVRAAICALTVSADAAVADESLSDPAERQSPDEAFWTGPLLASSASTLPQGHFLVEPYLYDSIAYGRFDSHGTRHSAPHEHDFGSLTYLLYGLTDTVTIGLIPRFGFRQVSGGQSSSGIGTGDLALQGQYRLTQFQEGSWIPTISLVAAETFPTGKYDRLDGRPSDGFGRGAYTTTLSVYAQSYFWMRNGRILRTRLDLSYSVSDHVSLQDVSVYGTPTGFRGHASPGDSFVADLAFEYSATRNWVVALDLVCERDGNTRLSGSYLRDYGSGLESISVQRGSGSSDTLFLAPAFEYNWSGKLGVIVGARLAAAGRNATATVTPVAAINYVY
jgi:hypothetical protein